MVLDLIIVAVIVLFIAFDAARGFLQGAIDAAISVGVMYTIVATNGDWRMPFCKMMPINTFFFMFLGLLVLGIVGGYIIYRATLIKPAGPAEHVLGAVFGLVTGMMVMRFFLLWGAYYQLPNYRKCIYEESRKEGVSDEAAQKACESKATWYQGWADSSGLLVEIIDLETLAGLWKGTKGLRDPGSEHYLLRKEGDEKYKEIKHKECIERVPTAVNDKKSDSKTKDNEKPKILPPVPVRPMR